MTEIKELMVTKPERQKVREPHGIGLADKLLRMWATGREKFKLASEVLCGASPAQSRLSEPFRGAGFWRLQECAELLAQSENAILNGKSY
jgi:hypothetical protein